MRPLYSSTRRGKGLGVVKDEEDDDDGGGERKGWEGKGRWCEPVSTSHSALSQQGLPWLIGCRLVKNRVPVSQCDTGVCVCVSWCGKGKNKK